MNVQAVSGRSNAAHDPARSVEDDHLRRDLYADVVELLDHGQEAFAEGGNLGRAAFQKLGNPVDFLRLSTARA